MSQPLTGYSELQSDSLTHMVLGIALIDALAGGLIMSQLAPPSSTAMSLLLWNNLRIALLLAAGAIAVGARSLARICHWCILVLLLSLVFASRETLHIPFTCKLCFPFVAGMSLITLVIDRVLARKLRVR